MRFVVPTRQAERYQQIVDRFEQVARANIAKPTTIMEFCREVAVTRRTLSRAFRAIRGTTPYHYLQQLRLSEVRRALSSGSDAAMVTKVAKRFGFRELGRFSARYREAFGERPSETKRRTRTLRGTPDHGTG
jgi:transcriptional regulator GlxA family with amidase domain